MNRRNLIIIAAVLAVVGYLVSRAAKTFTTPPPGVVPSPVVPPESIPPDTPVEALPPAVPGFCETTGSWVGDMALCQPWGEPGTVDLYQTPLEIPQNLAPPGEPPIVWETPNVVLGAYFGSCGLRYTQDGVFSLGMPPTCPGRVVCPEGTVPTTRGSGGFGCQQNTYTDCGKQVCADCRSGRCIPLEPNPGCDFFEYYRTQHNCAGWDAMNTNPPTGRTGTG
jgi:hypothetical protein